MGDDKVLKAAILLDEVTQDAIELYVRNHGPLGLIEFVMSCSTRPASELLRDSSFLEQHGIAFEGDIEERVENEIVGRMADARKEWYDEAQSALREMASRKVKVVRIE